MARIEKTVFISYRRVDRWPALAVFKDLTQHGYDVFIDYDGIASGDFERAIVDNIRARAHFLIVLTPEALERCGDPADWLRREIEAALEARRNIVPLLLNGFTFEAPAAVRRLRGALAALSRYQALKVPEDYFDAAMERLRSRYLAVNVDAVLHPASAHAQQVAQEQRNAASKAAVVAPAKEETVVQSAVPTSRPPAQALRAALAMGEGQAAAAVAPAGLKPHVWPLAMLLLAVAAVLVWAVVSSGRKKEEAVPLPLTVSIGKEKEKTASALPSATLLNKVPAGGPTYAAAQNALGDDYYFGRNGQTQDDAEAVNWYRKAAEQGNSSGQTNLGLMYQLGRGGLVEDDTEAVKWYRKAAEQGNELGQVFLAVMTEHGVGRLAKDRAQAVKLLYR